MKAPRIFAVFVLALAAAHAVWAATPKTVLILRGESSDLPSGPILIETIETTIRASASGPVEFYIENFDTGNGDAEGYDDRFGALLAEKYADTRIDLILAFAQPAARFILRERPILFPRTPILIGFVDERLFDEHALPPTASVVYVRADALQTLRFARAVYPRAHRALVVTGASGFDRGWERVVRQDLAGFDPAFPVSYDAQSSIDALERRVAALPPDTIVLFVSMTRDGANRPLQPVDALERLHAVATVPIFGLAGTHLGHGLMGGALIDFRRHGLDLGRQAVRMLAGEIPPPMVTPPVVAADWRELQRFDVDPSTLPPGVSIEFREPTLWDQYRGTILIAMAVLFAQFALILALVRAGARRRESQDALVQRLRFERQLSEFSAVVAHRPLAAVTGDLEPALERLLPLVGLDRVLPWTGTDPRDAAWRSVPLAAGQSAAFETRAELPPSLRGRLNGAGPMCHARALPLVSDGRPSGALFWFARHDTIDWAACSDQLKMVGTIVGNLLERKQTQVALEGSHSLKGAILDSLPAHIAVIDRDGAIIAVNDAWRAFALSNGGSIAVGGAGANYLEICRGAVRRGLHEARQAVELIERACRGEHGLEIEYRCESAAGVRWFTMTAEPLRRPEGGAVVAHTEITARKHQEIVLRESEDRFRNLADALPVAIWMSSDNGDCTYFNRGWLEMTGRTLDEERGDGWLEAVHSADRAACRDAYQRASYLRQHFTIEFRLRRHDGQYRWLFDTGVPRYGSDGSFHGYVGGCLDITERKQAEQTLRDLTRRLMSAQDDERRRIARELHDHLSQQLALLAIDLQQLSSHPPPRPEALIPVLQEAWRRTTEIASDVHAISHRLHPSKMEALGLVATIRAHCREVSRQSLAVDFVSQNVPPIPAERALCLFRVVEEALSNVVRHSSAHSAQVALAGGDDGTLLLRIADDGRGIVEGRRQASGLGLVSMRERIQSLDGTLSISSVSGRGTVVEARVPAAPIESPAGLQMPALGQRAESA
ncbi:MAG TPA: PAS domain S-box protein [Vicinamibacterales bacterium]|jgi:PAS domain S-box-containing protein